MRRLGVFRYKKNLSESKGKGGKKVWETLQKKGTEWGTKKHSFEKKGGVVLQGGEGGKGSTKVLFLPSEQNPIHIDANFQRKGGS